MRARRNDERGFTLPELMIVIVLLGILAAIAIPSWFGLVESREATSAANQVSADMRLAHTRATNRLTDWRFVATGGGTYRMGAASGSLSTRSLPSGVTLGPAVAMNFRANGEVRKADGGPLPNNPTEIEVRDRDGNVEYTILMNTQTSRVKID